MQQNEIETIIQYKRDQKYVGRFVRISGFFGLDSPSTQEMSSGIEKESNLFQAHSQSKFQKISRMNDSNSTRERERSWEPAHV